MTNDVVKMEDYFLTLALYVLIHIIRYTVILIFWPLMRKCGYGLSFQEMAVLGYSGLRGAVSIVLSLLLASKESVERSMRYHVLFHSCGIVLLTILINGVSVESLVKRLGLSKSKPPE